MAEGLARCLGPEVIEAYSAGTHPVGINPKAILVMEEIGIDLSNQSSKSVEAIDLDKMDLVVTLCGDAADHCPILPQHIVRVHWGLEDPAKFNGSEQMILGRFRETREQIRSLVNRLIDDLRSARSSVL
jgi:arsenate reductase